jgi:CubicO group peptidase (beta-lactamase class C family)
MSQLDQVVTEAGLATLRVPYRGEVAYASGPQDLPLPIHSIRKSLISALIGQLVETGLRLDTRLGQLGIDDCPGLDATEKSATIEHLLTSSSGVYLPLKFETSFDVFNNEPMSWPKRGSSAPGERFHYSNWDFNVLGELYQRISGTSLFVAIDRLLAQPLGFRDWDPLQHSHLRYADDPLGATVRFPNYAVDMSARDLAVFGQLYLDGGERHGRHILSAEWIGQSTRPLVGTGLPHPFEHYGYLWWVSTADSGLLPAGSYSAMGVGGQTLSVVPRHELVIVAMSDNRKGGSRRMGIPNDVTNVILTLAEQAAWT